jgi:hypothetical protein
MSKAMKITIKIEEAAMTAVGIYLLYIYNLNLPLWIWFLLFFSPDVSMLGYLFNTKVGALCYNLFHHKGVASAVMAVGYFTKIDIVLATGLLLFAHSSFDRITDYFLKYADHFKHTSLGWLPDGKHNAKLSVERPR